MATLSFLWVGETDEGRAHARALTSLGKPVTRRVEELSYLALQRREDTDQEYEVRHYGKGHYVR